MMCYSSLKLILILDLIQNIYKNTKLTSYLTVRNLQLPR